MPATIMTYRVDARVTAPGVATGAIPGKRAEIACDTSAGRDRTCRARPTCW